MLKSLKLKYWFEIKKHLIFHKINKLLTVEMRSLKEIFKKQKMWKTKKSHSKIQHKQVGVQNFYFKSFFLNNMQALTVKQDGYIREQRIPNTWLSNIRSSRSQVFYKIGLLKVFGIFTGKHLCWSLFLVKLLAFRPGTLLRRDSNTDTFLWTRYVKLPCCE